MLLFVDSFDNYSDLATAVLIKWQAAIGDLSGLSIDTTHPRTAGGQDLQFAGSPNAGYLQQTLVANKATLIVGFGFSITQFDGANQVGFFQCLDQGSVQQITVGLTPTGFITVRSGGNGGSVIATSTLPGIFQTGVYYFIEMKITFHASAGVVVINITGGGATTQIMNATGLNTAPSGTNSARSFRLGYLGGGVGPTGFTYRFDDFYACDTTGTYNNDILGDCRAVCLFPNAPGTTTNFTGVGASPNWQCANELSENADTDYVHGITPGDKDLYNHTPTPASTTQVLGAQLCGVMRKDDTGLRMVANTVKSAATLLDGATVSLTVNYAGYRDILEVDPATSVPFTKSGIDAMEIGAKVIS